MEPIRIADARSGSGATVATDLGFNCFEFRAGVGDRFVNVLAASPQFAAGTEPPSHHGIPILFPYPNRIRGGRYSWKGHEYHVPSEVVRYDPAGNAIHGFCLDRAWRVVEQGDDFLTGQFQLSREAPDRRELWPSDFVLEIRYRVRGAALRADIRIENPGEEPLPWGFGTHPYFQLPLSSDSTPGRCLIQAPARKQWELDACLPSGRVRDVTERTDLRDGEYFDVVRLDDVLTDLQASGGIIECLIVDEQAGLQVAQRFPTAFRELVVYSPPGRDAVCLEPYTCVTDAINLSARGIDAGWRVLAPGAEFRTWIEIEAGPVLA